MMQPPAAPTVSHARDGGRIPSTHPSIPLPDEYRRQLSETYAAAEREARWDGLRGWLRAVGEIVLWTSLGMALIFLAFFTHDETMGRIYWLVGCIVWIGGVAKAVLGAYRRGLDEGLW